MNTSLQNTSSTVTPFYWIWSESRAAYMFGAQLNGHLFRQRSLSQPTGCVSETWKATLCQQSSFLSGCHCRPLRTLSPGAAACRSPGNKLETRSVDLWARRLQFLNTSECLQKALAVFTYSSEKVFAFFFFLFFFCEYAAGVPHMEQSALVFRGLSPKRVSLRLITRAGRHLSQIFGITDPAVN